MGAADFRVTATGKDAAEAFHNATEQALWEHGHGGYTGTIAEKASFVMLTPPKGVRLEKWLRAKVEENDKWGPAFCISLGRKRVVIAQKLVSSTPCNACGGRGRTGGLYLAQSKFCVACNGGGKVMKFKEIAKHLPTFLFFGIASE